MKLKLKYKLFIFILSISFVIVFGIFITSRITFRYQFINYLEQRETKRIKRVALAVAENYPDKKDLNFLAEDLYILHRLSRELFRPEFKSPKNNNGKLMHGDERDFPPRPGMKPFFPKAPPVVILDENMNPLRGFMSKELALRAIPVKIKGKTIGWIGFYPERHIRLADEKRFLYNQYQTFLVIFIGMVFLSVIVAVWASYFLEKPIKVVANGARKMAGGNFDIKLPENNNDELGELSRSFNFLSGTLKKNEGDRKRWVADIAHELRTPLTLLRGELEAVEDGVRPLNSKTVKLLKKDIDLLIRLVNDLNELSKTDLGSVTYRKKNIYPSDILKRSMEKFSERFEEKRFTVNLSLNEKTSIYGDPGRIDQLFCNIIQNSIDYTEERGSLSVEMTESSGRVIIKFEDTKPSVPENDLGKLFDRLYRVESSRCRVYGGSGLGLAISRNIVIAHEGSIEAKQSELGGLSIIIKFPAI